MVLAMSYHTIQAYLENGVPKFSVKLLLFVLVITCGVIAFFFFETESHQMLKCKGNQSCLQLVK